MAERPPPPEEQWIDLREAAEIIFPKARTKEQKRRALRATRGAREREALDFSRPGGKIITTREWAEEYRDRARKRLLWIPPVGTSQSGDGHWRKVAEDLMAENALLRRRIEVLEGGRSSVGTEADTDEGEAATEWLG